jgi:hypothetical protein
MALPGQRSGREVLPVAVVPQNGSAGLPFAESEAIWNRLPFFCVAAGMGNVAVISCACIARGIRASSPANKRGLIFCKQFI